MDAAGIFGDVAADRAGNLARRIGRVVQTVRRGRLADRQIAHAALHDGSARDRIHFDDGIELCEGQRHAHRVRQCAARQASPRTPRNDGNIQRVTGRENGRYLRFGLRDHDDKRQLTIGRKRIAFIWRRLFAPVQDAACRQNSREARHHLRLPRRPRSGRIRRGRGTGFAHSRIIRPHDSSVMNGLSPSTNFESERHSKTTPIDPRGLTATAMISRYPCFFLFALMVAAAHAVPAPFDLAGPVLDVKISRGGSTLPAGQVPNLAPGDRIWLKADLPSSQSAHYLMIAAFLRGATNPPPENWFFACKTWTGKCATDGLTVTVPEGAGQVLVFLAPQTGGDFKTLVSAVRGRPGAFVRTSQDLNQAALDRSRLEKYLSTIHLLNDADPAKLTEAAPLLARSLAIKVDDKCLDRMPALQAPCLTQGQESLILNDGHSTSIVEALTSGPGSDLAMEASFTPQLSYGYYSPYIASVLDIARIFDSFRTAQYQYIPALASPQGDKLALILNAAPSFHSPQSVLVVALPAVETPQLPPLHAVNPKEIYCAGRTLLVLPVDGAPLVFSTGYAHDVTLSLTGKDGKSIELPATADAAQGGYLVDTSGLHSTALGDTAHATLQGYWGFERYHGPGFVLMNAHSKAWELINT